LTKRYGRVTAVDGVTFAIPRGGVTGLLGPNGAGKSTTIRMITGYLPPSSGSIRVDGMDVLTQSVAVRRRLGYLPESAPLYSEMKVTEFLHFRGKLFSMPRRDRLKAIDHVIKRCWLADVKSRPIGHLSKGYRQRVGLAATLLHDPAVLILDEPTVGLDPSQIREVRDFIRELAVSHTILLSTHILPEVERTCDRIIVLAAGRIRASGTLDELRRSTSQRSSYVVETDAPTAEQRLRKLAGVKKLELQRLDNRWLRVRVIPHKDSGDLRETIARELVTAGGTVRQLAAEGATLEQLFVQLVTGQETAEAPESAENSPPHAGAQRHEPLRMAGTAA
jgi:ABC-2 type transport system ATP-binding protein